MVTIVKQARLSFWRFREIYRFPLPPGRGDPIERILAFYRSRPLKRLSVEPGNLRFTRGTVLFTLWFSNDPRAKQNVSIRIIDGMVQCEFDCSAGLCHMRVRTSRLYLEVQRLEEFLGGPASERVRRRRLPIMAPVYWPLYWLYRFASGTRYRASRRLTRAGWMVFIGLIATTMMGSDTENTVVYQALPILLFLLLSAAAFSIFFRARFSANRLLPRFGSVGRPLYYRVMVKNLTSKTQSDLVLLENLSDPRPTYREWRDSFRADNRKIRAFRVSERRNRTHRLANAREAHVPTMPPKGEVEVRVELEPLRRGVLRFGGVTLARPDPFGLYRGFVKVPLAQTVLILPKRYSLPPIALPGIMKYQEGGVAMASNIGRSEEFVSLRDYRRGDPYRHIHWPSWAKTGKPIVKEFEDEFFVRHALVLDTFTDDPHSQAFEEAVSVAASFACTLISQESLLDLLFVGPQAFCFTAGRGLGHADQMLEILAAVQICQDEPFGTLEDLVVQHTASVSGCICVLLTWDERRRRLLQKLAALGVPTMVLLVVEPGSKPDLGAEQFGEIHILEAGKIEEGLAKL
ncbi:MAG TPA: DUF58 domain-containing protein [Verrucomicrobiae bacterium]|jgi:uncharacterized protein (DUF58 family)|nr:DUF58 domain-containing protein [Verrucomicrobiae bacterium]